MERRISPDGEEQWLGRDGYWYSSPQLAASARIPSVIPASAIPVPGPPSIYRRPAKRRKGRRANPLQVVLLAIIIGIAVVVFLATTGHHARFSATVTNIEASSDGSQLSVLVHVTNVGTATGNPTCSVSAHSPNYSDVGNEISPIYSSIDPGQDWSQTINVTITNNGAASVPKSDVSVSC